MKLCTLWYKMNQKGEYEYNHLEDGHCCTELPTQASTPHPSWNSGKWNRIHAFLTDDIPPKVILNSMSDEKR